MTHLGFLAFQSGFDLKVDSLTHGLLRLHAKHRHEPSQAFFSQCIRGSIPTFIHITDGKVHEFNTLDLLRIKYGACYLLDRGYLGFHRLLVIHQADAFLSPAPSPIQSSSAAIPVPQTEPAQASCATKPACCLFSLPTRTIQRRSGAWWSRTSGKRVTSLTNNFALKPELIADFCRQRWQVELFFQWIKQHLRIKTFFWNHRERGQGADLDCGLHLRADRDCQETPASAQQSS
jgi:hypothetical protein